MKNKLKIFLCVVMILVFSFGTCATAYAYTGYPTSIDKAVSIVKSYYSDELAGSVPVFFYTTDNKGPALLFLPDDYSADTIQVSKYGENFGLDFRVNDRNMYVFTFDKTNCYSKPFMWSATNAWMTVPYGINKNNASKRIIQSYKTILDVDGQTVLFQQGTKPSPNPNPETPPSTPGSNTLSTMFNKNSAMLNGVLQEIIALLPLLLPVLITFLAIRKGIKFTLQILRSS